MNQRSTVTRSVSISLGALLALASCGGKSPPPAGGGGGGDDPGGRMAAKIPDGIHGCTFKDDEGFEYGPHRCDVVAGEPRRLEKKSGMELFSGTMSESAEGIVVDGRGVCGEMSEGCDIAFTIKLTREGGTWSGPVVVAEGARWWLDGATFSITDAADYGGDTYGGAAYGGAAYGGE